MDFCTGLLHLRCVFFPVELQLMCQRKRGDSLEDETKFAKIGAEEWKQRRDKVKCFGRQKSWKIIKIWIKRKLKKNKPGWCTSILNFYSRNISDLGNKGRKQFPSYISNLTLFLATVILDNAKMFLWCHGILQLLQVLWWNLSNVKAYSLRSCTFLLPALCSCGIFPSVFLVKDLNDSSLNLPLR